ncbi:hypothetical protein F5884DRAFT_755225 [Xylogone sp. PMI_703]|nr:hypothetical protein F5884DRAFT_755225 [Xylogone sp. PMI_703]
MNPEDEFSDNERASLIQRLQHCLRDRHGIEHVSLEIWSAMWLSDLNNLRMIVEEVENDHLMALPWFTADAMTLYVKEIIKPWLQRDTSCLSECNVSDSDPNSPKKRQCIGSVDLRGSPGIKQGWRPTGSEAAKNRAAIRDEYSCALTQPGRPLRIAHIYAFSIYEAVGGNTYWSYLRMFWSAERVERWKKALLTEKRTEVCENLISMSPNAHAYWGRAYFALKPIKVSDDKKSMTVQFFWLQKSQVPKLVTLGEVPQTVATTNTVNKVKLHHYDTNEPLHSGEMITITTDDPVKTPLPSRDLLDMQWTLHRLTALCGGAEAIDYIYNPDEPDDYDPTSLGDEMYDRWDDDEATTDSSDDFSRELTVRLTPFANA